MSAILRQLVQRFYPQSHSVTIFGLDWTGKTTLLYLLRLNEIVQTIPTMGFNVEDVYAPTSSGKPLHFTGWDLGTGCGGTRFMLPMLASYTVNASAIIWMVDSSTSVAELDESCETLVKYLTHADRYRAENHGEAWQKLHRLPILILANKRDKPNPLPIDQIRLKFAQAAPGQIMAVFGVTLVNGLDNSGLAQAFDWLSIMFQLGNKAGTTATSSPAASGPKTREQDALQEKHTSWLVRAGDEKETSPEVFLEQFRSLKLPAWDHYTHIRIAYTILTTSGRQKGKDLIFDGIEKYITESSQTRGRTFHVTMTYFWIQIVHFGIRSMAPLLDRGIAVPPLTTATTVVSSEKAVSDDTKHTDDSVDLSTIAWASSTVLASSSSPTSLDVDGQIPTDETHTASQHSSGSPRPGALINPLGTPSPAEFARFLLLNPYVADGNLWAEYYSKEVMMSPQAKKEMVLPDKKALPSLVVRDAIRARAE